VRLVVLHRRGTLRHAALNGVEVRHVPSGALAAPALAVVMRALRARFRYDLVHAHDALPAGDAVVRARIGVPLVLSAHVVADERSRHAFDAARLVLADSAGIERDAGRLGARATRVVHPGTDIPEQVPHRRTVPTLVTAGPVVARKRHSDVVRALWLLRDRHPLLRYLVIGDGPEREPLARLAADLGVADRVELAGRLPHAEALARAATGHVFVMASVDEAFGVAYVEAMAAGLPAIGTRGEPGPQEIAGAGGGLLLVPPGDVEALAGRIDALLSEDGYLLELGQRARATVEAAFTWEACGRATVAAYEDALR
jgi:glycosyltransferase involved in cell wall biosynthesis